MAPFAEIKVGVTLLGALPWLALGLATFLPAPPSAPARAATASAVPPAAPEEHGGGFVPGELILRLKNDRASILRAQAPRGESVPGARFGLASLDALADRLDIREIRPALQPIHRDARRGGPSPLDPWFLVVLGAGRDSLDAVAAFRRDPAVEAAQLNYLYAPDRVPNDPLYVDQHEHQLTMAEAAWDVTTGQEPQRITIAVIGEGMELNHPDLAANIVAGYDFYDNDPLPIPGPSETHETPVAGVAAAVGDNLTGVAGVCWGCRIMPLRVNYTTLTVAQAIDYAAAHGARVINMSFGNYEINKYGPDTIVADEIDAAVAGGAVAVATAGNDWIDTPRYPGALPNVLGVAGTTYQDQRASFSNFGSQLDVSAPGTPYSTFVGGQYFHAFGTSFAAPCVSGLAGLILSRNPVLAPEDVRLIIEATSDRLSTDRFIGTGRVNHARAIGLNAPPPAFSVIKAPERGSLIGNGPVGIKGIALGASYTLEYKPRSSSTWTLLATGGRAIDGALGVLQAGPLPEGYYDLRLTSTAGASQAQDQIAVYRAASWPEATGWPRTGLDRILNTSPLYADLDADGFKEVVVAAGGAIEVFNHDGTPRPGWPRSMTSYDILTGPTVGDLDGDGDAEIVAASRIDGEVGAWDGAGSLLPGFPKSLGGQIWAPVTLANLDAEPGLEMIVVATSGSMHVFKVDGSELPGWPKSLDSNVQAPAAVGDFDSDGRLEIVVRQWQKIYVFRSDGSNVPGWPLSTLTTGHTQPVIADLDNSGALNIVDQEASTGVALYAPNGQWLWRWNPETISRYSNLSVGDIDDDFALEAFVGDDVGNVFGFEEFFSPPLYRSSAYADVGGAALVADFDGDGQKEVLAASAGGGLFIWEADGTIASAALLGEAISGSPAAGDLDGDGDLEVIVGTEAGTLHVFDLPAPFDPLLADWRMEHGDPSRTGQFRLREKILTPAGLQASVSTTESGRVDLSWQAEVWRVAGFEVFRNGSRIARLGNAPAFSDTQAEVGVPYQYAVRAFDADGYVSFPSNAVSITIVDTHPPTPPAKLEAAVGPRTGNRYKVNLGWSPARDDVGVNNLGVSGYIGYRDGVLVFEQDAATRWFVDADRRDGVTYTYVVTAFDDAGNPSDPSTIQVTPPDPAADCDPTNPQVWAIPGEVTGLLFLDGVTLSWVEPNVTGGAFLAYDTLRSSSRSDFNTAATCVESDATDTTSADAAVPNPGSAYYYLVRAENACPGGMGSLGFRSDGTPRQGIVCP